MLTGPFAGAAAGGLPSLQSIFIQDSVHLQEGLWGKPFKRINVIQKILELTLPRQGPRYKKLFLL